MEVVPNRMVDGDPQTLEPQSGGGGETRHHKQPCVGKVPHAATPLHLLLVTTCISAPIASGAEQRGVKY